MQRDVALFHAVDELHDGLLVILRREGGGEPQAEGPCRRKRRSAGERRVVFEHVLHVLAADDHEVELLTRHRELHTRDMLRADLIGDRARIVDEHAVVAVCDVERNVLIGDFGAGAAVLVPDIDALTVLDKRRKALAEAINLFADVEIHLRAHEARGLEVLAVHISEIEIHLIAHIVLIMRLDGADHRVAETVADACQLLVFIVIGKIARILCDDELCIAALDRDCLLGILNLQLAMRVIQLKRGHLLVAAHKMIRFNADNIRLRGRNKQLKQRTAHCAHVHGIRHRVEIHAVFFCLDFSDLNRIGICDAGLIHPVAFCEFHKLTAFQKNFKIPQITLALFFQVLYH